MGEFGNDDTQEPNLTAIQSELISLRAEIAALKAMVENDHKGLHTIRRVYEKFEALVYGSFSDIFDRLKCVEAHSYPQLGPMLQQINGIIKPPDSPSAETPEPPELSKS